MPDLTDPAAAPAPAASIASLIPSGTDIVAALGLGHRLVGVSHECDHPIAEGLPVLTASTLTADMAPAEVDAAVSASVADGHSLYRTDRPKLHELAPAVVLSQDVCDVCAVNGEVARGEVPEGSDLVMLTAVRLDDLWDDLRRVGRAAGAEEAADAATADARFALDVVRAAVGGAERPRVVALDWGDPPFAAGHWVPDLVDVAGGVDVLATADPMSRRITWDEVADARPDVVLFLPCGYTRAEAVEEAARLPLVDIAGRTGAQVWALDASRLLSRCTPQAVVAGASALASVLHPERIGVPHPADAVRIA